MLDIMCLSSNSHDVGTDGTDPREGGGRGACASHARPQIRRRERERQRANLSFPHRHRPVVAVHLSCGE